MKIVILGAGRVGATLASHLTIEDNDISVIDNNQQSLTAIQERLDVKTVLGHAGHPKNLEQAGIEDADMLIAVTNSDDLNMMACQIASKLYQTPTKIARIRSTFYTSHKQLFAPDKIDIDLIFSPEQLLCEFIEQVIEYAGTLQVLPFANGRLLLVVVEVDLGASLVGQSIRQIPAWLLGTQSPHIFAIYRNGQPITFDANTVIEANDEIFFLCASHQCREMIGLLKENHTPYKRLIIAGGGHIGAMLAKKLEENHPIKIIEHNTHQASYLADTLKNTIVLCGNASDKQLLLDEHIDDTDVFCALTNDDEANIMSSLLAKKLGVRKVMTLVNQNDYVALIEDGAIDIVISPQQTTLSGFLRHIRQGDIKQVHTLRRGAAEAIELIAHGDETNSRVVGKRLAEIALPVGARIGAIVRENRVIMARDNLVLRAEDHVVIFLQDVQMIHQVERLFQVELNFF